MSDRHIASRLADMLRRAYWASHDEQLLFAIPDDAQASVLQFLRLHIIPVEHVPENFEQHFQCSGDTMIAPARNYATEMRRLRRLTKTQRLKLFRDLMHAAGYVKRGDDWEEPMEGMADIEVFVFDPMTGTHLIRSGIGTHLLAVIALYEKIRPAELGPRWPLPPSERRRDMLTRMEATVAGFILHLPDWQTPFLHLWSKEPGLSESDWLASVRLVQQQRTFLVVDHFGRSVPFSTTR